MRPVAAIAVAALAALPLAGCGDELTADEAREALEQTPYEIELNETVEGEGGGGEVISGTATNSQGTTLEFAVAVDGATMPKEILGRLGTIDYSVWDTGWEEAWGVAPPDRPPPSAAVSKQQARMELTIEDAYCEFVSCEFFPD